MPWPFVTYSTYKDAVEAIAAAESRAEHYAYIAASQFKQITALLKAVDAHKADQAELEYLRIMVAQYEIQSQQDPRAVPIPPEGE